MTSCGHPIRKPPRGRGQNPVESLSQTANLTLNRLSDGHEASPQEIAQDIQPWPGAIAKLGGLEPKTVVPVLLELAGESFQSPAVEDLMPKSPKNRLDAIAESRPEGGWPQGMHRRTVVAAIFDRPDRLDVPFEIAGNVAVDPGPSPLTLRAARRPRPRISLAFFRQPLYFHPKMKYQ